MSEFVVETCGLTKRYGAVVAVQDLTMRVRRGEVYGFLGPNGVGKTTTLRMLLGLARPSAGQATVLGAWPGSSRPLRRTSATVEAPGLYPFLSGRDNLRVLASHAGAPTQRIPTVLEQAGLADRADRQFGTYSQGIKHRPLHGSSHRTARRTDRRAPRRRGAASHGRPADGGAPGAGSPRPRQPPGRTGGRRVDRLPPPHARRPGAHSHVWRAALAITPRTRTDPGGPHAGK